VVLSACQTARGKLARGEGVMGLTRGLFYAGARGVVSTNWSVAVTPTNDLVADFFEGLHTGLDAARALQRAQRLVRRRSYGKHPGADPFFWAGFALYGDPD
jgi:CHAT domain-containing protein